MENSKQITRFRWRDAKKLSKFAENIKEDGSIDAGLPLKSVNCNPYVATTVEDVFGEEYYGTVQATGMYPCLLLVSAKKVGSNYNVSFIKLVVGTGCSVTAYQGTGISPTSKFYTLVQNGTAIINA